MAVSEIIMSDGLVLTMRRITMTQPQSAAHIYEVTSVAGGEAGWRGYGVNLGEAVADLYRAKAAARAPS